MNHIVKIEYKVTAYVAVYNSSELDNDSIIARAEDVLNGIPEKDFYWNKHSVEITCTDGFPYNYYGEELKTDCCISECEFNQLLNRK